MDSVTRLETLPSTNFSLSYLLPPIEGLDLQAELETRSL